MHTSSRDLFDVSVVIPTYNRSALLGQTLRSLRSLALPTGVRVEVLVCDDGSGDDSFSVAKGYETQLSLRYCYQPDTGHRPAPARNMGLSLARGRLVLFLDCGVIATPRLITEHLAAHARRDTPSFVIGPMWGYHAAESDVWASLNEEGSLEEALKDALLADPRMGVWEAADWNIEHFSAPWSLGWSTNISIPRRSLLAVDGFDEAFEGWGAEDIDLAYRLYQSGLTFAVCRDAMTLHLPHDEGSGDGRNTNYHNKKRIFAKSPVLATELLPAFGTGRYSQHLDEIRAVVRRALVPDYLSHWDTSSVRWLRHNLERPVVLFGAGTGELGVALDCALTYEPDQARVERARGRYPWLHAQCLAGVNTGLDEQPLGSVLITDYWRAFAPNVVREIVGEAQRIAAQVYLCHSPEYDVPAIATAPPWDEEQLQALLAERNVTLQEVHRAQDTTVYHLQTASDAP